jgi:hypothetical protein
MPCACFCAVGAGCKKNTKKQHLFLKIFSLIALLKISPVLTFFVDKANIKI